MRAVGARLGSQPCADKRSQHRDAENAQPARRRPALGRALLGIIVGWVLDARRSSDFSLPLAGFGISALRIPFRSKANRSAWSLATLSLALADGMRAGSSFRRGES